VHSTMLDYLHHLESVRNAGSLRRHRHDLEWFWRWAQSASVDPVAATLDDLRRYQVALSEHRSKSGKALSAASQVKRLATARTYFRFLLRRGLIGADISRELKLPKVVRHVTQRDYLSLQEATALLQTQAKRVTACKQSSLKWAIELRNLAFFSLAIATGRRHGGLSQLKVKDLDFVRDEIRVDHEKGKTGRVLPVARWAMITAKEYVEKARSRFATAELSDLLFIGKRKPRVTVHTNDVLKELQRQTVEENPDLPELATKELTTHGLRVTFAKLLFNGGCNLRSVNELMLHDRLSTTAYYTPLTLEELRRACRVSHPRA